MDRRTRSLTNGSDEHNIVPLPGEPARPALPARPLGRLHSIATAGMVLSAVVALIAFVAFITIGWPGRSGRIVMAIVVISVALFLACGSIAVLAAARDTYAIRSYRREPADGD